MTHRYDRIALLGTLAGIVLCTTEAALAAGAVPAPRPATPTASVAVTQALSGTGEGRRLWLKLNCYGCHGDRAGGGMGPRVVGAELGDVSEAVLQGQEGGMLSYRNYVSSLDLNNLALYLRSIGTATEPKFKDWWVPVPTK